MIMKLLTEGKTKKVFSTSKDDEVLLFFKDDITAFDGVKHDVLKGKGFLNASISAALFQVLESNGFKTHFVDFIPPNIIIAKKLQMIPLEVVGRNIVAGSLTKRIPLEPGIKLNSPICEFFLKDDNLHDPLINDEHICNVLQIVNHEEIEYMRQTVKKICKILDKYFNDRKITLVDFKIEYGRLDDQIYVGDELNGTVRTC